MDAGRITIPLSDEQLTVIRNTDDLFCVKGWDSERHSNVADELHILLSGSCQIEVDEQSYALQAGMAILIRAGRFHMAHRTTPDIERISLMLKADGQGRLDTLLQNLSGPPFLLSADALSLCRQLDGNETPPLPYREELAAARMTMILIDILRAASPASPPAGLPSRSAPWQTNMAMIDEFFSPWPEAIGSETDLAQRLRLSRHQLNRIIQQNYGMSFRQKLKLAKMDYASWLLRSTDYSCYQISMLCGYTAESSFYKAFGAYFNMSPRTYRQKYGKKEPE